MNNLERLQYIVNNPAQFKLYVETELNKVIIWAGSTPHKWRTFDTDRMVEWEVKSRGELEWSVQVKGDDGICYNLTVSPDLKTIIVTHGNTDFGAGSMKQALQNATVISVLAMLYYSLEDMFKEIMRDKSPNHYGLT